MLSSWEETVERRLSFIFQKIELMSYSLRLKTTVARNVWAF